MSKIRFVGLDVHAETIAVAVAEMGGEVRSLGSIPNKPESVRKLIGKLGPVGTLRCCYEAGPTGYVLYWQLTQLGVACEVIAPSLVPSKAGGSGQDRPARRRKAGAMLPCRRVDGGMGAGRGARSIARSGSGARSGEERPTAAPASAGQISAASRQASHRCGKALDAKVCELDSDSRVLRTAGAGRDSGALPGRNRSHRRADCKAGTSHRRSSEAIGAGDSRGDRSATGLARGSADDSGHRGERTGQFVP